MVEVYSGSGLLPDEGCSAVMGSNLLSFFSDVTKEDKRFIKNSMRWAECEADLRFNRRRESAAWFEHYSGVMWSVGWSLDHAPVIVSDRNFSGDVLQVWEKSLSMQLSREKLKRMKETFQSLELDLNGTDVFTSSTQKTGDFRFSPAGYNLHKELEIVISNVRLLSSEWVSTYLFWKIKHEGSQLDIQSRRFVITPGQINKYREQLNLAVIERRLREVELAR
jgi:hypothetical protein